MRKGKLVGASVLAAALALVGAQSLGARSATPLRFGANLTNESQPSNAEGGQTCDENAGIPQGATCSWVSVQAYHNGGHEKAPKTGTIGQVRLVSCVGGSFRLQFAQVKPNQRMARVVRNGPLITYKADPRQIDGDDNTVCGGDNGDDYIIQIFRVNLHVNKGEYIAIKTARTGALYCSGGDGVALYSPPLAPGQAFRNRTGGASCNLLVQLQYA